MIEVKIPLRMLQKLDRLSSTLIRAAGADQRIWLREAGEYMHTEIASRFAAEAGGSGRWRKLAESTIKERRNLLKRGVIRGVGEAHPILQRKGSLLKAATGNFNRNQYWAGTSYKGTPIKSIWRFDTLGTVGGSRSRQGITQHSLTIGIESEDNYAGMLNRARPFFYTTKKNEQRVRGIFQRRIREAIRRARG